MLFPERRPIVDYLEFAAGEGDGGERLDALLAAKTGFSRSFVKKLVERGYAAADGEVRRSSYIVKPGDTLSLEIPEEEPDGIEPEPIPLDIIYQDADIAVVNKPAGMAVHPSPGHARGTLAGALLFNLKVLSTVQGTLRPGIVHRLDKNTSGVMVVARNDAAHRALARQFKDRTVRKQYVALVHGQPGTRTGSVERPVGRSIHGPGEMAVDGIDAKEAYTEYEMLDAVGPFSMLRAFPRTGRTHQIRVHLAHLGCPILCDALYGRESVLRLGEVLGGSRKGEPGEGQAFMLSRHALHALKLSFRHPVSGYPLTFEQSMPEDMAGFWQELKGALS